MNERIGWIRPEALAELETENARLRAERDALLDLRDKARDWRDFDGRVTRAALIAAVDALAEPTEETQPAECDHDYDEPHPGVWVCDHCGHVVHGVFRPAHTEGAQP